jgi:hypothetical protein
MGRVERYFEKMSKPKIGQITNIIVKTDTLWELWQSCLELTWEQIKNYYSMNHIYFRHLILAIIPLLPLLAFHFFYPDWMPGRITIIIVAVNVLLQALTAEWQVRHYNEIKQKTNTK